MARTKKVTKTKKEYENQLYSDSWIYIMLLMTLVLLTHSIENYYFIIDNIQLTISLFLLPIIYFILNVITKKYGYSKTIQAISISGLALVLFVILIEFVVGNGLSFDSIYGEFCAYVISCFVNLTIYYFLLNNTNMSRLAILLNYIFVLIVYYFIYTLFSINLLYLDNFWIAYFSTLLIQLFICIIISFVDKYIKRGI